MTGQEALNDLIEDLQQDKGVSIICKEKVEKSLKALEIIKEKNVNIFSFKRDIKQLGNRFIYKYYQSNLGNYHSGFNIQELTEEEYETIKDVLE